MGFPSGYRFKPTDEELVVDYLKNKILNKALPCNIIKELNLYDYHPQQLHDIVSADSHKEGDKFMYFFTPRDRKYPRGKRPKRQANNGYWKASGVDNAVTIDNIKVASKRSLVYYSGNNKNSTKTNWIMYEYVMDQHSTPATGNPAYDKKSQAVASSSNASPNDNMRLDDWVLCKVYLKNHKSKNNNQAATSSGDSSISAGRQMQGNDGSNLQHNLDSAISMASIMQRTHQNVGNNHNVATLIQQNDGGNLQHNLDSTGSMASMQGAHHNAAGYHNFAPFMQGTDHHHHQCNLQNYGGPIKVLPPLQLSHYNFGSTRAAQPMEATNYHNAGSTNFPPETQTQYNWQHYVGPIGMSPSIQPSDIAPTSTAVSMIENDCNPTNYVGSTCAAPAVQGANIGCGATDNVGSTNYMTDNVVGTINSEPPMRRMDQCNVGDNYSYINSEPFLTDYDLDDSYLQLQDPDLYLTSFDKKKPDSPN